MARTMRRMGRVMVAAAAALLVAGPGIASAETGSADAGSSSGSGTGFASGSASGSATLPVASPRAMAALSIATTQTGKPYEWGATGPNSFDCSGLVQWAFRQVGILLPRTTWQQAQAGSPVPFGAMMPGDVVIVNRDGSHEGIYTGAGQLFNAHSQGVPVGLTPLSEFQIYAIRRFF
ncbi:NlpC/P60 family protein [Nocardia terpenica]|nr:NlpC/P60 family protein [Nocardia terpenica]NQE87008.1 C40 family peptidase [Nocardia terpenica]